MLEALNIESRHFCKSHSHAMDSKAEGDRKRISTKQFKYRRNQLHNQKSSQVKTWLRANMKQQRFNNVALLHIHKARTDKIRLLDVANEFVQRNETVFATLVNSLI